MKHITKDGKKIPLQELTTGHLINIIKKIRNSSKEGIKIKTGISDSYGIDYDEEIITGYLVLEQYNYDEYVGELLKRIEKGIIQIK